MLLEAISILFYYTVYIHGRYNSPPNYCLASNTTMNIHLCPGCPNQVKGVNFLDCCRFSYKYHLTCLNFNRQDFCGFYQDFKEKWIFPTYMCKESKYGDNSNTSIRSTANPPQTQRPLRLQRPQHHRVLDEFVTLRGKSHRVCQCSCISNESIRAYERNCIESSTRD